MAPITMASVGSPMATMIAGGDQQDHDHGVGELRQEDAPRRHGGRLFEFVGSVPLAPLGDLGGREPGRAALVSSSATIAAVSSAHQG